MSDGKIDIQAPQQINITSQSSIKLEANSIVINGKEQVQIKGEEQDVAVNGKNLYKLLMNIARTCDSKVPASGGVISGVVQAS